MKKQITCLTGAGISAESGLATFRGGGGLWDGHRVEEVATPSAWSREPDIVNAFYNGRRRALTVVKPNAAHIALKELEANYDVHIITQNVDNLHERGGSSKVLHLHGRLDTVRSQVDPTFVLPWEEDLFISDICPHGQPFRPNIVWFGEAVPAMADAERITRSSDLFLIIGTSLQVYPAAGLIQSVADHVPIIYIDPNPAIVSSRRVVIIPKTAVAAIDDMFATITDLIGED